MVGDELQSIYGFRHADLEVFREQRRRVEADPGSVAIELSGNFRSRPEVIGAVNEIGATPARRRVPAAAGRARPRALPAPPGEGPAVELLMTGEKGWDEKGIDLQSVDRRPHPA